MKSILATLVCLASFVSAAEPSITDLSKPTSLQFKHDIELERPNSEVNLFRARLSVELEKDKIQSGLSYWSAPGYERNDQRAGCFLESESIGKITAASNGGKTWQIRLVKHEKADSSVRGGFYYRDEFQLNVEGRPGTAKLVCRNLCVDVDQKKCESRLPIETRALVTMLGPSQWQADQISNKNLSTVAMNSQGRQKKAVVAEAAK